jgi:coronin-1B/1C/6
MSGRFVRASLFRHVVGEPARRDDCFLGLKPVTSGEGNYLAANHKYIAMGKTGGGGPMYILNVDAPGRHALDHPTVNVHRGKVLDLDFNPFNPDLLASASDDATVKITHIPEGGVTENLRDYVVSLEGHQKRVLWSKFNPVAENAIATGSYDHTVKLWDIEAQAEVLNFAEHTELIQSLAWNRNGSMIGTTSKDKNIRLFDIRAPESLVTVEGHAGGKSSRICFGDNKNKIFVTGFTRTSARKIAVYDPRDMENKIEDVDIDQSAGVMIPYYDEDTSILYVVGKGDGQVRYYEVVDEDGETMVLIDSFRSTEPQKGAGFAPKVACDYMACEITRMYRVIKDGVEPVQFIVPRKSELFQEDIYPETISSNPALTFSEWIEGANADPEMIDIREAAAAAGEVREFVAKKSPAELEKELAEANARIKELEAELASLRG